MQTISAMTSGGTIAPRCDATTGRTRTSDHGEALIRALPRRPRGMELAVEDPGRNHGFNFRSEDVVKGQASRPESFANPDHDLVGIVDDGSIVVARRSRFHRSYPVHVPRGAVPHIRRTVDAELLFIIGSVEVDVTTAGDLKGPRARCLRPALVNRGLSDKGVRREFALNAR